jgi:hypothetical protein
MRKDANCNSLNNKYVSCNGYVMIDAVETPSEICPAREA